MFLQKIGRPQFGKRTPVVGSAGVKDVVTSDVVRVFLHYDCCHAINTSSVNGSNMLELGWRVRQRPVVVEAALFDNE